MVIIITNDNSSNDNDDDNNDNNNDIISVEEMSRLPIKKDVNRNCWNEVKT